MCLLGGNFCGLQQNSSESQYFIFDVANVIAFKGMMFWRAQLAGVSVVDIIADCGMILLFLHRMWWIEISGHVDIWIPYYFRAAC